MPYIKLKDRKRYQIYEATPVPLTPGELNYVLTLITMRALGPSPNYEAYNSAMGVLECCKQELYRRVIAVYENKKIAENGDVFSTKEN